MPSKTDKINLNLTSLQMLRTASKKVLNFKPESKTLADAYEECMYHFKSLASNKKWKAVYACKRCGALTCVDLPSCWACGEDFLGGSPGDLKVMRWRADAAGVQWDGTEELNVLKKKVESAERRLGRLRDREILEAESIRLNSKLKDLMPLGWSIRESGLGTTYLDSRSERRIFVPRKGLAVQFSVSDSFFVDERDVEFFDAAERRRRHYGRTNFIYSDDIQSKVMELIQRVFEEYA